MEKVVMEKSFAVFKSEETELLSSYITLCAEIKECDGKSLKKLFSKKIKYDSEKKKDTVKGKIQRLGGDALNLTPYKFVEWIITIGLETPPMKKLLVKVVNDSFSKKWYLKIRDIITEAVEKDNLKIMIDFGITDYTKLIDKIKRKIKIKGKDEYTKLIGESIDIWNSEISEEIKQKVFYYVLTSGVLNKMIAELQGQILTLIKEFASKKGNVKLEIQNIDLGIKKNL